jgi:tetratricopeptide (TPR) repeat protein
MPRLLLGPLANATTYLPTLPADGPFLTFGREGAAVSVSAAASWEEICHRLPRAWQPEAVIVVLGPEAIPAGVWSAPVPVIALALNGSCRWHFYRAVLNRCDLVICDHATADALRRLGIDYIHVPTRWDAAPLPLGSIVPHVPRDIDLLFMGDLHPAAQRECLPWLGRLARLRRRWHVYLQPASKPHDPNDLLQRARLFFHHGHDVASIQRLWAAAATGALPLVPEGTSAAGSLWQDGHNCVRYTADNLETVLEHYLENEEERRQLAEAAEQTARSSVTPDLWPELLAFLESNGTALAEHAARRTAWDRHKELLAMTWQALSDSKPADDRLITELTATVEAAPSPVSLRHALGMTAAAKGEHANAAEHFHRVLEAEPSHVLAGLYCAEALVHAGRGREAVEQARQSLTVLESLEHLDPVLLDSPPYTSGRDVFGVEWEQAAWQHAGDSEGECRAKHTLLRWRLHGLLARQTGELVHRYEAALSRPDLPATRATLGSALHQAGRSTEAVHHLRQAIAANPFDAAAARMLYESLGLLGRTAEQQRLVEERRLLCQAAPQAIAAEGWFLEPPTQPLPTRRPPVSLCMIVKDEESNLPRCLASAADLVQEIIVVDTGSRDGTKNVARRYGAKVYDFTWCDSFAAARNECLRHASGQWVFWLDADDTLDAANRQKLGTLFATLGDDLAAYLLRLHSLPDPASGTVLVVDQVKLFRNDPRLRWEYRVHEQIIPALLRLGGVTRKTDIVIHHSGYQEPHVRRRKLERNRRLLLLDQAERPDDPLILFNLGTLHLDLGQPAEAMAFLQRGLERTPANYSLAPRFHSLLACSLYRLGRKQEALAACRRGRTTFPDESELLYWEAQLLSEMGNEAGAEACWRRLLSLSASPALACLDPGIHGYKSRHQLAELCRRQGRIGEAEQLWREALAERPDFMPAWLGLAELYLSVGRASELAADLARLEPEASMREAAWAVRVRLHLARSEFAAARALLEEKVRSSPDLLWARLLLGQALVQEGRDREAAMRELHEVLSLDPHHVEARRLLARIQELGESAD